ncbi:MAG: hypothetical protein NTW21_44625 [Verrucomicrobia bacterium]|nr:hypothetical protein [Verrucomicrobiota bacterium]
MDFQRFAKFQILGLDKNADFGHTHGWTNYTVGRNDMLIAMKSSLTKNLGLALLLSSTALAGDDPLFRIKEHGKWGFINSSGDVVIAPQDDDCYYQYIRYCLKPMRGKRSPS